MKDKIIKEIMNESIQESLKSTFEDTFPHPKVGAILVKDGKILGKAHRNEDGKGTHAEVILLRDKFKDESLEGCTLYTTLEPSNVKDDNNVSALDLIIDKKIREVFIGMTQPNPGLDSVISILVDLANITVIRYPDDLIKEIEDLNNIFYKNQKYSKVIKRKIDKSTYQKFIEEPIDDTYKRINRMYWNLNYNKSPFAIFSHLVEVIGGMSLLASDKKKIGIIPKGNVSKAIAWWFALCGKLGVRSISALLWDKYPIVCPYCLKTPHETIECEKAKKKSSNPNWSGLALLKQNTVDKRPSTLKEWQLNFMKIYPVSREENYGKCFARLTEELGELAEALRIFSAAPGHFLSEAADVFAWLMHLQNLIELKSDIEYDKLGNQLNDKIANSYPGFCKDCGEDICACPPILAKTIGRITNDVPLDKELYGQNGRFFTPEEAGSKFGNFI